MKAPHNIYAICKRCFRAYVALGRKSHTKNFIYRRRLTTAGHEVSVADKRIVCCVCEEPSFSGDEMPDYDCVSFYALTKPELDAAFKEIVDGQSDEKTLTPSKG